jgi:hypothetical protein
MGCVARLPDEVSRHIMSAQTRNVGRRKKSGDQDYGEAKADIGNRRWRVHRTPFSEGAQVRRFGAQGSTVPPCTCINTLHNQLPNSSFRCPLNALWGDALLLQNLLAIVLCFVV